jgi:hypothetical protein
MPVANTASNGGFYSFIASLKRFKVNFGFMFESPKLVQKQPKICKKIYKYLGSLHSNSLITTTNKL